MRHQLTFVAPVYQLSQAPQDGLPEICISGRSNVGKSSMINRLAGRKNLAKTSQTPGKTQALNYYSVDSACYVVDLPGYGYAKTSHAQRAQFERLIGEYLDNRTELRGLIQLLDSRHGPVNSDRSILEWLGSWDRRVLYVFTKADKLSVQQQHTLNQQYSKEFGVENMTLFSARTGAGLDTVWSWIQQVASER